MTALDWIQNYGVRVSLEGTEHIRLEGLDSLQIKQAEKVVELAKENKPHLLGELHARKIGNYTLFSGPMCKHCIHHSVTCVCKGPCTARGMVRDPDCFACHTFVEKTPRRAWRPAYYGKGPTGRLE
jgi:hypothetical protein